MSGDANQSTGDDYKNQLLDKIKRDAVNNSEFGPLWHRVGQYMLVAVFGCLTVAAINFSPILGVGLTILIVALALLAAVVGWRTFENNYKNSHPELRLSGVSPQDKLIRYAQLLGIFDQSDIDAYVKHKSSTLFPRSANVVVGGLLVGVGAVIVTLPGVLPHLSSISALGHSLVAPIIASLLACLACFAIGYGCTFSDCISKHRTMFSEEVPVACENAQLQTFSFISENGEEIQCKIPLSFDPKLSAGASQVDVEDAFNEAERNALLACVLKVPAEEVYVPPDNERKDVCEVCPGSREVIVQSFGGDVYKCRDVISCSDIDKVETKEEVEALVKSVLCKHHADLDSDKEQFDVQYGDGAAQSSSDKFSGARMKHGLFAPGGGGSFAVVWRGNSNDGP